jgi:hypothetical protein
VAFPTAYESAPFPSAGNALEDKGCEHFKLDRKEVYDRKLELIDRERYNEITQSQRRE